MKRKWHHPKETETSHQHWRSLGELEDSKEFGDWLEREFPQGAAEFERDETSRRDFVKLMGASTALAGFGVACSRPVAHLIPFNEHVEWSVPGKALYYSTIRPLPGGGGQPLVATTYDGRPTKVDGNKLHPARSGGTDNFTQASILELYDPDRSRGYLADGKETTAKDFDEKFLAPFVENKSGEKVAMLMDRSTSPARNELLKQVSQSYPGISLFGYGALDGEGRVEAEKELYGENVSTCIDLSKAKRILSVDCDFLGYDSVGEDSKWEFSRGRNVDGAHPEEMNRLYVVEPSFTLTGGMADHRYRLSSSQVFSFLALLAREIGGSAGSIGAGLKLVDSVFDGEWISQCAADLVESRGESVVVVGSRCSKACHHLAAAINDALGAYGSLIQGVKGDWVSLGSIGELSAAIDGGSVETLIVIGEGDPFFDAPADLNFSEKLESLDTLVHVGPRVNLTARAANWHVPGAHYLECWGDCCTQSGYYSVQQPMIQPLWGGVSEIEFLLKLVSAEEGEGEKVTPLEIVKKSAEKTGEKWTDLLRKGFAARPLLGEVNLSVDSGKIGAAIAGEKVVDFPYPEALDVVFAVGPNFDGRFANNGWLQEAPDPITKLTWDNAALVSIKTAEILDLEDGDLVELSKDGASVEVPVLKSPGHADYTLSIPVGYYGDETLGRVCDKVGFNVYPLKDSNAPVVVQGVGLKKLGRKHELALTAEHYSMEGRAIVREGTVEMLEEDPHFAGHQGMDHHIPENISLYKGPDYLGEDEKARKINESNQSMTLEGREFRVDPNHQWAMTIDLNACTGCNACVIACQAENNIPIVGKDQVMAGREMHWIRMDRYFTSPKDHETVSERGFRFEDEPGKRKVDDDAIEMLPQPVACQQCESAPCETVCPVNATVHTSDGLNAMTYNRCIGTRYCANNCPYKARRFNYYDYNKRPIDEMQVGPLKAPGIEFGPLAPANGHGTTSKLLQKNPNVTVRMRGVIEKCTYCVQRLNAAKASAKVAARDSADIQVKANSVSVACQDACPHEAIVFGNLKADGDRVVESKKNPRGYDLLKYIGTLPRTSYLARIKNPNMKMPGADKVGTVTAKMH